MTKTERVLIDMLTENTGMHMLDSGGAYGRNWEHNQKRNFLEEDEVCLNFDKEYGWIEFEINLFHFLNRALEYDSAMTRKFNAWAMNKENKDEAWLALQDEFPEWLEKRYGYDIEDEGIYNTANGEDLCGQVIQYGRFEADVKGKYWGTYISLSIHGGCDIRGGYTSVKIFQETEDFTLWDSNRGTIFCNGNGFNGKQLNISDKIKKDRCPANWYFDGSSWGYDGGWGNGLELEKIMDNERLQIDEDGVATCPMCHKGQLEGMMA